MKNETVKLGDKRITVRELTVKEIKELFDFPEEAPVVDLLTFLLSTSCKGITQEELLEFSPSELEPLIDSMLKVNTAFFAQSKQVGMGDVGAALEKMIGAISMTALLP